jgi:cytochrome P450
MAPWMKTMGKPRAKNFFYALAEEAAHNEDGKDNYAKKLFELAPKYNLSEMELSTLSGSLFGAGSDTSSSTLITFLLACCAFPEVLPRAWEELDRVVGPHRSPNFEDEPNLIYVKAFAKEVLRWRSVAIIGGQPHAPIQDEIYKVKVFIHLAEDLTNR